MPDNLVKVFPASEVKKRSVDGLNFRVGQARIYGLLGRVRVRNASSSLRRLPRCLAHEG